MSQWFWGQTGFGKGTKLYCHNCKMTPSKVTYKDGIWYCKCGSICEVKEKEKNNG